MDPNNEEAVWVTVVLHPEMEYTIPTKRFQIRMKREGISRYALHNHGKVHISLPIINRTEDTYKILLHAENDDHAWLKLVTDRTVAIVRNIVFR
ncbi:hypothetical protein N7457_007753 [Penicillium paradoxum]|uniref:uncharacterized protein n=1 Tax=Penicillium paradoxum TaxID=176176 RepID=UPI002548342B|nr:uncharacterized protein N7457_007753 [Penicillium paradoxum]KAJ5772857.1 hypothetical protein N7457_007753 [Penicillium paradoxum]